MMRTGLLLAALGLSVSASAADVSAGEQIFQTYCHTCHGVEGKGDGPVAAALTPKPANFTSAEFWASRDEAGVKAVISKGGAAFGKSPMMAAWGDIIKQEGVDNVYAFVVAKFKPGAAAPVAPVAPAAPGG